MNKIKSIITALGNQRINEELKNNKLNILNNDILYKEGILEYLENNKKIDYLIIDEKLPGNIKMEEIIKLVNKINKNIKIIFISEKNINYKVYKILKEININEIKNIINSDNIFNQKTIPINNFFSDKKGLTISILGSNGIGKSIFSILYAQNKKDKKVLIIDFDILNNSLHTILGVKNYNNKIKNKIKKEYIKNNLNNLIIKINNNIDLISGINLIMDKKERINISEFKNLINKIKNNYDYIIIDTSSECFFEYNKEIIKMSNFSIFISGANLLEINKTKKLLDIYKNEWQIDNKKINIIFNKCTSQSIDDNVLKNIFNNYNILGKIKLSEYYDMAINENNVQKIKIKSELKNIQKNINK